MVTTGLIKLILFGTLWVSFLGVGCGIFLLGEVEILPLDSPS